jgi:hypothetical protein
MLLSHQASQLRLAQMVGECVDMTGNTQTPNWQREVMSGLDMLVSGVGQVLFEYTTKDHAENQCGNGGSILTGCGVPKDIKLTRDWRDGLHWGACA